MKWVGERVGETSFRSQGEKRKTRTFRLLVWGSGFRFQGSGFRVQGLGFRVEV